jgi:hypothetical protein
MLALTEVATSSALREEPIPHTNGIGTCEIQLVRNLLSEQSQSTATAFSPLLKAAQQIVPSQSKPSNRPIAEIYANLGDCQSG